jgi:hypothetical protein
MRSKVMWGTIILLSSTTFAGCQASQPVDAAANEPQPMLELPAEQPAPQPVTVKAAVQPKTAAAKTAKPAASPKVAAVSTSAKTPEATPLTTDTPAATPSAVAAAAQAQDDEESVATTMTGCLVHDDNVYRLKDTDGMHAPKTRSWKSGFIKRSSARVDLLGATDRLSSHIGYRVSVSGTLTDREMEVRSVRATTERCD